MQVIMHNSRYNPYLKPLKISIPESAPMIPINPRVLPRFDYVPYYHFGTFYNQLGVQHNLPTANQPVQKNGLKFGIDTILGLNKTNSNTSSNMYPNENSQPETLRLAEASSPASNYCLASSNSSPTSSSSSYSPTLVNERSTESEVSRYTSSPESSDSVSSCNKGPSPPAEVGAEKSKRVRTIFSTDQMARLEQEFSQSQYMVGQERKYLAQVLNLTENQVKIWFQNRRIKWRKQNY